MAELFDILAKGVLTLSAPNNTLTFDDTAYTPITVIDTIRVERGVVTTNPTNGQITVQDTGLYEIKAAMSAELGSNDELQVILGINGIPFTAEPGSVQGAGVGKPIEASWSLPVNLTSGDVLEICCRNGDTGTIQPLFRRILFSVTKDSA